MTQFTVLTLVALVLGGCVPSKPSSTKENENEKKTESDRLSCTAFLEVEGGSKIVDDEKLSDKMWSIMVSNASYAASADVDADVSPPYLTAFISLKDNEDGPPLALMGANFANRWILTTIDKGKRITFGCE